MTKYQFTLENYNRDWSIQCAKLMCISRGEPVESADGYLSDGELRVPTMLYAVMVEVMRLVDLLLPAMAAGEVEKSQALITHLNSYVTLIKSIPIVNDQSDKGVIDIIYSVVARFNGRWPL